MKPYGGTHYRVRKSRITGRWYINKVDWCYYKGKVTQHQSVYGGMWRRFKSPGDALDWLRGKLT